VPEYAGYGPLDGCGALERHITARCRRGDGERAARLEEWLAAFAPACRTSGIARSTYDRLLFTAHRKGKDGVEGPASRGPTPPPTETMEVERAGGFAGLGLDSALLLLVVFKLATWVVQAVGLSYVVLVFLRVFRRSRADLAHLGIAGPRKLLRATLRTPELVLGHSPLAYITQRDKLTAIVGVLLYMLTLATHDAALRALAAREYAPPALFAGLPGHPASIAYLDELARREPSPARDEFLAAARASAALAGVETQERPARRALEALPDAGVALALLEHRGGGAEGERALRRAAEEGESPAACWAVSTWPPAESAAAARARGQELAPHGFATREVACEEGISPTLWVPAPPRAARDEAVLGSPHWARAIPWFLLRYFGGHQDPQQLERDFVRVFQREPDANHRYLFRLRNGFFILLPLAALLFVGGLFFPAHRWRLDAVASEGAERAKRLFRALIPGVRQAERGGSPFGFLLLWCFWVGVLIFAYAGTPDFWQAVPFSTLARLVCEPDAAWLEAVMRLRALILPLLLCVYGIHWFDLHRERRREDERRVAMASSIQNVEPLR
jgi:hypothetical protein